ncbi:MAG: F-type H+-transporting ATPase subunit gamma [Thermoleophilaceae bacterium]|jgi:F-type H+-transporting ATPase subunit gamma|nr:F-type H+-transporting ATPase subunit gamma [Thermoleophilaceae bacterium]
MATQKETRDRIASIKNIQKITRAMEMVAAARLRRAEQRIEHMRPYARALRRLTARVVDNVENIPNMPLLEDRENVEKVAILIVTGDRGLAGAFNSQIIRAANRRYRELTSEGKEVVWYAVGKRGVGSLNFRGYEVVGAYEGFTDRPAFTDARKIGEDLAAAYIDKKVDRVETFHNHYISPLTQETRHETLLPLQEMAKLMEEITEEGPDDGSDEGSAIDQSRSLWTFEPEPEEILQRLIPDYIEISLYRRLLESTASEHGARMTAMRSASENAGELISNYTLEMNRQRQAEITQEIMEVVAGAEGLS